MNSALFVIMTISLIFFYFLPSIIAAKKENATAIFAANLLLGWTGLGWVLCFIWSLTGNKKEVKA